MDLLDNTPNIKGTTVDDDKDPILLIIPIGVKPPANFPLKVHTWNLGLFISELAGTTGAVVQELDADLIAATVKFATALGIEVKALRGMEGDYPSYWMISTSAMPQVTVSEIMTLAEQSEAAGGPGIAQNKLVDKSIKLPKPGHDDKIKELAASEWGANNAVDE